MNANPCRDLVLYMPVWRADWVDEVPALISEEEDLVQMIRKQDRMHYDEPFFAVAIEHEMWTKWYIPNEISRPATFWEGERHKNLDWEAPLALLSAPILTADYQFVCRRRCLCDCHTQPKAKL
ncbi:hypothetical protein B0H11DRAFT_2264338 [Mycena galericulata]|nr:hypothetical protein B0H11DRAFT_2264338 [Mycena galericulata]